MRWSKFRDTNTELGDKDAICHFQETVKSGKVEKKVGFRKFEERSAILFPNGELLVFKDSHTGRRYPLGDLITFRYERYKDNAFIFELGVKDKKKITLRLGADWAEEIVKFQVDLTFGHTTHPWPFITPVETTTSFDAAQRTPSDETQQRTLRSFSPRDVAYIEKVIRTT